MRAFVPLLAALAACSDYGVTRSELSDEVESAEVTLAEGGATEVTLKMEADAEALAAAPTNWVDITVFALRQERAPIVRAAAASESIEEPITTISYLELVVDDPLRRCLDPDAEGLETTMRDNGSCVVLLPVGLSVRDGSVSLQVTAHYELSFGRQEPPGEMGISIAD